MFTRARMAGGFQRVVLGNATPPGWKRYSERVVRRGRPGEYTILLRELRGLRGRGLGAVNTSGLVATGAATAGSAIAAGAGAGAAAGPIGAGIGALVGLIAGLWSAHAARAKGATTENAAVSSAVTAFDSSLQAVFQAANAGSITGTQAAGVCTTILQSYWQGMAPYQTGPGRADASKGGANCGGSTLVPGGCSLVGGLPCNKSCTAGCCVGCGDLMPTILQAIAVFNSPTGGTITACQVYGAGYGYSGRASYSLTYKPPAPSVTSAAGIAAAATSVSSSLVSGTIAGIPTWAVLAGAGLGIFALTR